MRAFLRPGEYRQLLDAASELGWRAKLMLVLAYETGHRGKSIRMLRWSDIDFDKRSVLWRGENAKTGREEVTPLTPEAMRVLRETQKHQMGIGKAWVLPSPSDPSRPCSRNLARDWWEKLEKASGLERVRRKGWHSLRRTFGWRTQDLPLVTAMKLGGWRDPKILVDCYQKADFEEMEDGLTKLRTA